MKGISQSIAEQNEAVENSLRLGFLAINRDIRGLCLPIYA